MSQLIFKNYGGSHQLRIQNAADLEKIEALDDALWAATSVPISSLNCDSAFLSYIDTDQNGRIRSDELKAAQAWLFHFLAERSHLSEASDKLNLSDIDTSHPEGQRLRQAAKLILSNLNSAGAGKISLAQVRDVQNIMASAANNGDGIIPPQAAADSELAQFITSVMDTVGPALDASGKPGISEEQLKLFFSEAQAYLSWKEKGEIPQGNDTTEIMPWGSETAQAYKLVISLEEKIEQYFTQCAIVGFDKRSQAQMQLRQKELEQLDFTDTSMMQERLKNAPLALPDPKGILDLERMINPLYIERLSELKKKVLKRALGGPVKQLLGGPVKQLTEKQWQKVKAVFAPYRIWLEGKQGIKVEKLGPDLLRAYLNGPYRKRVTELITKDLAVADELNQLHSLEKLLLYQRWLLELANNFVSFANLYSPGRRSLFEMGRLVIDGREMSFTMRIDDRPAHKKLAEKSFICLLYLEVTGRRQKEIKFEIVAAVTSGTAGGLCIGKRGIFFTTDGKEWDAQVVDIVENPISIWESVKAPFQQFAGFIKKQVDKFSKTSQNKMQATMAAPSASGTTRDLLLGGGIAIAAVGSALAYITKALSQVRAVHILGMLAGIVILVLLPGMIIGFTKIRKRDMSVLLEASGWAVNVHMRLSATLGRLFTRIPHLPSGARKERRDALAQLVKEFDYSSLRSRKPAIIVLITILIALALVSVLFAFPALKLLVHN